MWRARPRRRSRCSRGWCCSTWRVSGPDTFTAARTARSRRRTIRSCATGRRCSRSGLALELHADLRGIQWAKLLLNLNNPVNALSGLPLKAELQDRDFRRCLAALQQEGLAALAAAGIAPAQLSPLPARWLPAVLRLPTPIFRRIAARMLRIDEKARSSMAEDFALGRPTEIDALCGEVVRLAERHGLRAPVNRKTIERIEAWPTEPRAYSGAELRAALGV
jgi:2-dehydropantoate 2-reductase